MPAREECPVGYSGDDDFLDAFDRTLIETAGFGPIGSAELEPIIQRAFRQDDRQQRTVHAVPLEGRARPALREHRRMVPTPNWPIDRQEGSMTRHDIEDEIERLPSILDAMDGDADLEDDSAELDLLSFIWGSGEGGGPAHSGA